MKLLNYKTHEISVSDNRKFHTATLLPTGMVLVAGGDDGNQGQNTSELYDTLIGSFSSAKLMLGDCARYSYFYPN